jgi:cytoskeleton protein RodZ
MDESIGERLMQLRESRALSLEQVSRATHIRLHYLKSIEAGDLKALPSSAQARGFIRAYASYLGLESHTLAESLAREIPASDPPTSPRPAPSQVEEKPAGQAEQIYGEIGSRLHTQREQLGLSLDDVERHTHIRSHYLQALEDGDIKGLPSPVQGRGMLKNYASFLGLETEPLLLRYAEGLQAGLAARQAEQPPRRPAAVRRDWSERSVLQRLLSTDFLIGGFVIIFMAGFFIWGGMRIIELRAVNAALTATQDASETAAALLNGTLEPGSVDELAAAGTALTLEAPLTETPGLADLPQLPVPETQTIDPLTGLPVEATETGQSGLPAPSSSPIQVYVMVQQRAWMRAIIDNEVEFDGRVIPGSVYQFDGENRVEILTGNGAALQLYYNQQDLGLMGILGQVVHRIFTREGIATPTPSATPTGRPPATATLTPEGFEEPTPAPEGEGSAPTSSPTPTPFPFIGP